MKSQLSFLLSLLENMFHDAGHCVRRDDLDRDLRTLKERTSHEGLPFLTVTLPTFWKAVLQGLEHGVFIPPAGFSLARDSRLPKFMRGWTKRIFDHDGQLRPDPDKDSISELYQVCAACYKLSHPYSTSKEEAVSNAFISNEDTVKAFVLPDDCLNRGIRALARRIIGNILSDVQWSGIKPKHGPGATADRKSGNAKYHWTTKYQRLHSQFPYYEYFAPSLSALSVIGNLNRYRNLKPSVLPVAKVCLVPKDSRGPRLISMEPSEIQWIQQGMHRLMVDVIESHPLSKGKVNFRSDLKNRNKALTSSVSGHLATLDLKDASDMIPLELVRDLFPASFLEKAEACRSVATTLPSGRVVSLAKFAPMGSALCFPVMALTLFALTTAACRLWRVETNEICVFGDDLIVPTESVSLVTRVLTSHCLKVNSEKSFSRGKFRESCGMDAYDGQVVTPIRVRHAPGGTSHPSSVYTHLIELSESFFEKGYWRTCAFLRAQVDKTFGFVPWVYTRSCPGYYCPDYLTALSRNGKRLRTNVPYQRTEVRARSVSTNQRLSGGGWTVRLLKGLVGLYEFQHENWMVPLKGQRSLRWGWNPV